MGADPAKAMELDPRRALDDLGFPHAVEVQRNSLQGTDEILIFPMSDRLLAVTKDRIYVYIPKAVRGHYYF